jgi:Rad3-related DNA helicase
MTADKACLVLACLLAWFARKAAMFSCLLQQVCPYYLPREDKILNDAQLILMPYNYIIDPVARRGLHIQWDNAVVLFDEAHNLVRR